jgi:hypothetical protein
VWLALTGLHPLHRVGQFLAKRRRRTILCDPPRSLQVMVMLLGEDELANLHLRPSGTPTSSGTATGGSTLALFLMGARRGT